MANSYLDHNQLTERAEAFDAYVQFQIGVDGNAVYHRLKSLQEVEMNYSWSDDDHYADDGTIQLVRTGQNHTCEINLILTKSEAQADAGTNIATGWTTAPSDTKTLSYWIYQRELGNRVQMNVVQVFATKVSSGDNQIRHRFTMDITDISISRGVPGGAIKVKVSGRIVTSTHLKLEEAGEVTA
tara:strand:+ start:21 stop:572 length:552 start_codon:yes stop_codon:yes gene_type:complete